MATPTWSKRIKQARDEYGWSQEDLAARISTNTNQNTISRWEKGISKPNSTSRQRLSEVFGKSQKELGFLEERDEATPESELIESELIESERQEFPPPLPTPTPVTTQGLHTSEATQSQLPFGLRTRGIVLAIIVVIAIIAGGFAFYTVTHPRIPATHPSISTVPQETLTVPFKAGLAGVPTKKAYTGIVTIEVSGWGIASGAQKSDAFYIFTDTNGNDKAPQHTRNFSLCINGKAVDDFVDAVPPYSANHTYSFQMFAPGGSLSLGICDNGVNDNTGSFIVKVSLSTRPFKTVQVPLMKGSQAVRTTSSYQGSIIITVSGTGQALGKDYSDAFYVYTVDKGQTPATGYPVSGFSLCINGTPVPSLVQTIPPYNQDHTYTFRMTAPGGYLTFGICDPHPEDNTGSFTVTISQ